MTLVQTVICRDLIIQVSDRRLTTGNGVLFDDNTNKSVLWCNTIALGFTGIAFIDRGQRKATSEFITEALVGVNIHNLSAGVETLRAKVQDAVNSLPANFPEQRLTITASGPALRNGKLVGVSYHLSNFELEHATLSKAQKDFVSAYLVVENVVNFEYSTSGAGVPINIARDCRRGVSKALRAGNINGAIRILVETQRRVAAINRTVGEDALVVSLPRAVNPGTASILMSNVECRIGRGRFQDTYVYFHATGII